jgi:hypothetical protein
VHRTLSGDSPDSPVNYSGANSRSWRVQSRSPLGHRTLSGGAPDSPVNYSEAPLRIPEGDEFSLEFPCARPRQPSVVPCSLCLNPFLGLFIGLL